MLRDSLLHMLLARHALIKQMRVRVLKQVCAAVASFAPLHSIIKHCPSINFERANRAF